MKKKSFKYSLYIFIAAIALQGCVLGLHIYLRDRLEDESRMSRHISRLENVFLTTLIEEDEALRGGLEQEQLSHRYKTLHELAKEERLDLNGSRFEERGRLYGEYVLLDQDRRQLHQQLNTLLPALTSSVRYIHEHHIAYLKNLLSRGRLDQDYDHDVNFKRSPVHSATELDIIDVAVSIQSSMLDIFDSFSQLERGLSPTEIDVEFRHRIKNFYALVNTLEDYSLDAQDGLLVEELLLNGRTFEDSFTRFVEIEKRRMALEGKRLENRRQIMYQLSKTGKQIESSNRNMERQIKKLQFFMVLVSFFMLVFMFFLVKHMMDAFQRTIHETGRIRSDISYRIPISEKEYAESSTVFQAMNAMAQTISSQVARLKDSRNLLEARVAERTSELSQVNEKLLDEIRERIDNEKKRQELEAKLNRAEKMEAIGALAGGVAHDLNNILSGIMSYPELILLDLAPDDPLRKPIRTIQSSGEKAATIVSDLLTLARRGVANFAPMDINGMVRKFLESPECEKMLLYHPKVDIKTNLAADIGQMLGSEVHLSKSLMNLISNGAEAMPDGGTIYISTARQYVDFVIRRYDDVKQGEYLKLTVSDTGAGIEPDDLERIFEPFFTKKQMGRSGTGLGMAVVWGTVKDHSGYIDVESKPGKGTTFVLYFPMDRREIVLKTQTFLSPSQYMGRGESVLVVDDIAEQREIAVRILKRLGYVVHSVSSGEESVAFIKNQDVQIDIILLDMIMRPGIDGLETYRRICELCPGQKAVIASGFSESEQVDEVQRLGAGPYLKKPYTFEQIGVAVRSELDRE